MMPIRLFWNEEGKCGGVTLLRYSVVPLLLWSTLVEAMRVWNAEHGDLQRCWKTALGV